MIVSLSWQKQHSEDGLASQPGSGEPLEDYTKFNTSSPSVESNKVGVRAGIKMPKFIWKFLESRDKCVFMLSTQRVAFDSLQFGS